MAALKMLVVLCALLFSGVGARQLLDNDQADNVIQCNNLKGLIADDNKCRLTVPGFDITGVYTTRLLGPLIES